MWDSADVIEASEIVAKMQTLSEDRAARVLSLIEDLAELEARENAEDLAAARASLADPGEAITLDELEKRLALRAIASSSSLHPRNSSNGCAMNRSSAASSKPFAPSKPMPVRKAV